MTKEQVKPFIDKVIVVYWPTSNATRIMKLKNIRPSVYRSPYDVFDGCGPVVAINQNGSIGISGSNGWLLFENVTVQLADRSMLTKLILQSDNIDAVIALRILYKEIK